MQGCKTKNHAPAAKGGQMAIQHTRAPKADEQRNYDVKPSHDGSSRKRLHQLVLAGCFGIVAIGSIGCTASTGIFRKARNSDCVDDLMVKYRNRVMAEKAWHCRKDGFCGNADNDVFKDGFIAGYLDIAEGGRGCTPVMAPRQYWGWRYQSAGGQGAVGSWFGGFPYGVQAAEEAGLGTFVKPAHCNSCAQPAGMPFVDPNYPGTMGVPVDGMMMSPDGMTTQPVPTDGSPGLIDATNNGSAKAPATTTKQAPAKPASPGKKLEVPGKADIPAKPKLAKPAATDSVSIEGPDAYIASLPQSDVVGSNVSQTVGSVNASLDDSAETISIEEIFGLAPQEAAVVETKDTSLPFSFE
jgi:hypothetical protein